jgi:hypothetical protein
MGFLEERCNKQLGFSLIATALVIGAHAAYLYSKDTENVWTEVGNNSILYVVVFIGTYLVLTTRAQDACTSAAKPMIATTTNPIAVQTKSFNRLNNASGNSSGPLLSQ